MRRFFWIAVAFAAAASPLSAHAEVPLNGYFIARANCPALQSIRNLTNPGDITTTTDRAYPVFAKNAEAASHYLIGVDGAEPVRRWVATSCGEHVVPADILSRPAGGKPALDDEPVVAGEPGTRPLPTRADRTGRAEYVLAFSWQPAFCETRPDKPECKSQTDQRFDASHFSLHGLWPQPRSRDYCNIGEEQQELDRKSRWSQLDPVELDAATRAELDKVMPGTQSALERHEWVKHGSCYDGASAQAYFSDSLALMRAINDSPLQALFASNVGSELKGNAVREAFERAFGEGAGSRLRIACARDGGRQIITEITVGLAGRIGAEPDLPALLAAAPATDPGCPGGIVDAVGLQ